MPPTIFNRLAKGRPAAPQEKTKVDPAQKLLDWLQQHWTKPTISRRDISVIGLKSYLRGRESFQGETLDFLWFDEEPPSDVYFEALRADPGSS